MRYLLVAGALAATIGSQTAFAASSAIVSQTAAARHGLTRAWFAQARMDSSLGKVESMVLDSGVLFIQSNRAMVQAIDAETGETLWARIVGRPDYPTLTPGPSKDTLAVINGSRLYVVNRHNGDLLYETQVDGAPGAGAGVSEKRAYVPMVTGMIMAYTLEPTTDPLKELGKIGAPQTAEQKEEAEENRRENLRLSQETIPPLACASEGRISTPPRVTFQSAEEEFVAWATDKGFMYVGRIDRRAEDMLELKYRLKTAARIAARPTYRPPDPNRPGDAGLIFVASEDGFVHAVDARLGRATWRFSTGEPVIEPTALVDDQLFVANQLGGMYCLEAATGEQLWFAPRVTQFVAASKDRVYAADKLGRIEVLYRPTGQRLDLVDVGRQAVRLTNMQTDRIYLATENGLIQCLRETEQSEPLVYNQPEIQPAVPAAAEPAAAPGPAAPAVANPFGNAAPVPPAAPGQPPARPAGGAAPPPAKPAQPNDPFGGGANPFE
jgi:hypothetical protein